MECTRQGRIVKGLSGLYEVLTDTDGRFLCPARGLFRHADIKPTVGDLVTLRCDTDDPEGTAVIREILPRKNVLIRPPLANLDVLFCVVAAAKPAPVLETLDKLLATAEHNAIEPVLIVTKSDFSDAESARLTAIYAGAGFRVFPVSAEEGQGIAELRAFIDGRIRNGVTAAFAGASGVGKSTLLNRLFPGLDLPTGEISKKIARGKNTTRHVELFPVSGENAAPGYLADTPGFSLLDFARFDFFELDDLFDAFREFAPYRGGCRYPDCTHTGEGVNECAIARAVSEGKIAPSRHESYKSLFRILDGKRHTYH